MRANTRRGSRAGFTLIETMVVVTILAILAQALVDSASSMGRITTAGNVRSVLQEQGERALSAVIPELRKSSFITLGGRDFPYVFDDGQAAPAFSDHSHEPAVTTAEEGDPDFGPTREIVFAQPLDADADGAPDIDQDSGQLLWSNSVTSFTVETWEDGRNHLVRRVDGGEPESLARDVERVVFDTRASSGWEIPLESVRVRIYLRRRGDDGAVYRHTSEVLLHLRN